MDIHEENEQLRMEVDRLRAVIADYENDTEVLKKYVFLPYYESEVRFSICPPVSYATSSESPLPATTKARYIVYHYDQRVGKYKWRYRFYKFEF